MRNAQFTFNTYLMYVYGIEEHGDTLEITFTHLLYYSHLNKSG